MWATGKFAWLVIQPRLHHFTSSQLGFVSLYEPHCSNLPPIKTENQCSTKDVIIGLFPHKTFDMSK